MSFIWYAAGLEMYADSAPPPLKYAPAFKISPTVVLLGAFNTVFCAGC